MSRFAARWALGGAFLALTCCSAGGSSGPCDPGDSDGLTGGSYTFDVTVDDTSFTPQILKAQNLSSVTVRVTNAGTKPHGFSVGCIDTPNTQGCPAQSCFAAAATVGPVAPGASATATFATPNPEGIYPITSGVAGDMASAQFVVQ
jgi:hypothetical protein